MVYSKESDGYIYQRSVQPTQVMAFQEENEEGPSQSTYFPYPTQYQVPNFVWPLGHMYRMQAREEEPPCRRTNARSRDSDEYISHIAKARIRGKTQAILEGLISSKDMQPVTDESSLESLSSVQHRRCHILDLPREKQIEQIASMNARSQEDLTAWQHYLDCYTRGLINLMEPDAPPAPGANFQFLSALHPPNEAQRMHVSSRYYTFWTQQPESERIGLLLTRCLKQFGVKYGSLSFFDNNYENFKVESGYRDKRINREISIAAHALYSSEVLVIPDAQLDWRFEGNPLVARKPQIRSFAGAPLISAEGEVFAVLSIFEKQPRNFTAEECTLLAECSAEMVNELDCLIEPSFRTTPLLERDSVIDGKYANRGISSSLRDFSTGRVESQFLPPPLNPRARKPTAASGSRDLCSVNKMAGYTEPTPPPSAESSNSFYDPLCPRAYTPGFYSTSSLTTVPLQSPRTSPLDYRNAADLATRPDLNYVTKSISPLDKDFAESEREMWTDNEDNLVDKCIRSQRLGAGHPQMLNPIDDPNMQEDKASVRDFANDLRQFHMPHHPEPLAREHTEPVQASPFQPMSSNRAQIQHPEPCPFPANEAQEIKPYIQNTNQYSENHLAHTSDEVAEQTEVPGDQYPRPLEQGPPIVQRNEKLRKFGKLVGIIGTGGYV